MDQLRRECGFNGSSQQQPLEKMDESSREMELEKDSMGGPGGGEVLAGGPPTREESPQQEFEQRISCGRTRDDSLGASASAAFDPALGEVLAEHNVLGNGAGLVGNGAGSLGIGGVVGEGIIAGHAAKKPRLVKATSNAPHSNIGKDAEPLTTDVFNLHAFGQATLPVGDRFHQALALEVLARAGAC